MNFEDGTNPPFFTVLKYGTNFIVLEPLFRGEMNASKKKKTFSLGMS